MALSNIIDVAAWPKNVPHDRGLPPESQLVCVFLKNVVIDNIEETLFLRRTKNIDELWVDGDVGRWISVKRKRRGDEEEAALEMFEALIRARIGHEWPVRILREGIVGNVAFSELISRVEAELSAKAKEAQGNISPIVATAETLRLHPAPAGTHPQLWRANCPGTGHTLYINTEIDQFFCGYCGRHGRSDTLKDFVSERKALRETQ